MTTAVPLALVAMAVLTVLVRRLPVAAGDEVTASAARATLVVVGGWVLVAPYALPWYDVGIWAPLVLMTPSVLDQAMVARSAILAVAYVPGRVVGLSPQVEEVTLGFRTLVAPWLIGLLAGDARLRRAQCVPVGLFVLSARFRRIYG